MPESPNELSLFAEMRRNANVKLARDLSATFDAIAKVAMRASAEFSELENDNGVLPKIQKAHSVVTLLIDDAMRGLNEATFSALTFALATGLETSETE